MGESVRQFPVGREHGGQKPQASSAYPATRGAPQVLIKVSPNIADKLA
jgi:hypothetical protein